MVRDRHRSGEAGEFVISASAQMAGQAK